MPAFVEGWMTLMVKRNKSQANYLKIYDIQHRILWRQAFESRHAKEEKSHCEHFQLNFTLSVLSYRNMLFIIQTDSLKGSIFFFFSKAFKITSAVTYIILLPHKSLWEMHTSEHLRPATHPLSRLFEAVLAWWMAGTSSGLTVKQHKISRWRCGGGRV